MNEREKSDSPIVPKNSSNNDPAMDGSAEKGEESGLAKRNPDRQSRDRNQCRATLSQALERIRQAAKEERLGVMTQGRSLVR